MNFILWCIAIALVVAIGGFFLNLIFIAIALIITGIAAFIGYVIDQFKTFFTKEEV